MNLGFIGYGEVGFEMSKGFKSEGLNNIHAYDVMQNDATYGRLVKERAENAGVCLLNHSQAVIEIADIIIVAVPGDKALETAKSVKEFLKKDTIYVDVSASSPQVKIKIYEEIKEKGVLFVDGAMLGSLPVYKHKVPTLISGNGIDRFFDAMKPYNMDLGKISEAPGDATAIKLVRSIFMKGLPALFVEVLEAASIMKVDHLVLKSLADTMDSCSFEQTFNRLVTGSAVHAARRAHEMKNVIEMLESINVKPTMAQATYERLSWLASQNMKAKFAGKTPEKWKEVVEAWQ